MENIMKPDVWDDPEVKAAFIEAIAALCRLGVVTENLMAELRRKS